MNSLGKKFQHRPSAGALPSPSDFSERGVTLTEYALMASLLVALLMVGIWTIGILGADNITTAGEALEQATDSPDPGPGSGPGPGHSGY